jgi:ABC transporter substrate binding protein
VDVRTPDHDKVEQYPQLAVRLAAAGVDVILASNPYAVEAATGATSTVPIVAVDFESDPVARGWVTSLGRPGGCARERAAVPRDRARRPGRPTRAPAPGRRLARRCCEGPAGGLLAYGPVFVESFRRAASYVDRVLKGAQPAELRVRRPTSFECVINRKTARSIGLTIPSALLARADRVIQ